MQAFMQMLAASVRAVQPAPPPASSLAKYTAEELAAAFTPPSAEERALRQLVTKVNARQDIEVARLHFIQLAMTSSSSLSEVEIIAAQYALFSETLSDLVFYYRDIVYQAPDVLLRNHNAFVASRMFRGNATWITDYATALANLHKPLFPATAKKDFEAANLALLTKAASGLVDGAGPHIQRTMRISGGAPYLPIVTDGVGASAVDAEQLRGGFQHMESAMQQLSDHLDQLHTSVAALHRRIDGLENRPARGSDGYYGGGRGAGSYGAGRGEEASSRVDRTRN